MSTIESGVICALFLAVLGCYVFIFKVSNELNHEIDDLKVGITDRLARVEEQLKALLRYLNSKGRNGGKD